MRGEEGDVSLRADFLMRVDGVGVSEWDVATGKLLSCCWIGCGILEMI
jgi:hypothetical protein